MPTFFGYHVEKDPGDDGRELQTAYHLVSPGGAHLTLVRTVGHPDVLYAADTVSVHVVTVGGYARFSDRTGRLQPLER